jgi:hypothetical protein
VGPRIFLLWRGLAFRDRMEPAHVFTFLCFLVLLDLRTGLGLTASALLSVGTSIVCRTLVADEGLALGCESDDPALTGRERVGELATNGSRPKKDHRLGVLMGVKAGDLLPSKF